MRMRGRAEVVVGVGADMVDVGGASVRLVRAVSGQEERKREQERVRLSGRRCGGRRNAGRKDPRREENEQRRWAPCGSAAIVGRVPYVPRERRKWRSRRKKRARSRRTSVGEAESVERVVLQQCGGTERSCGEGERLKDEDALLIRGSWRRQSWLLVWRLAVRMRADGHSWLKTIRRRC